MIVIKSKAGKSIEKCYLLLVLIALVFTLIVMKESALAGIYLLVLTMPWSFMTTALLDKLHIQDSIPIAIKLGILIAEAFVNASILYCIGAMIEKTKMEGRDKWTQL